MTTIFIIIGSLIVLFLFLKFFFNPVAQKLYFKYMKYKADTRHSVTGRQQFLVPMGKRYYILDNTNMKTYNKVARKKGIRQLRYIDLLEIAYYKTSAGCLQR